MMYFISFVIVSLFVFAYYACKAHVNSLYGDE